MNSIEQDLKQCLKMISADWKMQNNYFDKIQILYIKQRH